MYYRPDGLVPFLPFIVLDRAVGHGDCLVRHLPPPSSPGSSSPAPSSLTQPSSTTAATVCSRSYCCSGSLRWVSTIYMGWMSPTVVAGRGLELQSAPFIFSVLVYKRDNESAWSFCAGRCFW